MGKEKPLEHDLEIKPSFSSHAADWLNTFKKHFTIAFQDVASSLPDNPDDADLQRATVLAMTTTLRESGISEEQMLVYLSEALEGMQLPAVEWTQDLNQRRIDLIDRKIEGNISYDEKIELANLTNAMRASVDNEEFFPMAGARSLHDKLKSMESKADQR